MKYPLPALLFLILAPTAAGQLWEECNLLRTHDGGNPGDFFGWVGREAGDVDGDSVLDVVVGAPGWSSGNGRAYVYSGANGQLLFTHDGTTGARLGTDVGPAGDLDGDGFAEVIVGAPGSGTLAGYAVVLSGPSGAVFATLSPSVSGDRFGASTIGPGDIDGDGVGDLLVGAPSDDTLFLNAGRAYVYTAGGVLVRTHDGETSNDAFGSAVGGFDDRDGDGHAEYVVGAHQAGPIFQGRGYAYDGATGSLWQAYDASPVGAAFGQFFCGRAGDVDADGVGDFFFSDWGDGALGFNTGRVFVYSGADGSLLHDLIGDQPGGAYGIGRGWAGDWDGDGHDDLFFAAYTANDGAPNAGKGILRSGATGEVLATWHGDVAQASIGFDAAGLGDVDGDGRADFLLTSATINSNQGLAHVVVSAPLLPRELCAGAQNSTGQAARLRQRRSTSIATNELRLSVTDGVPGELAVYFYGSGRGRVPLADGYLCVAGPLFRIGTVQTLGGAGEHDLDLDFTQAPLAAGPGAIAPGSTWFFQCAYRDPGGPGGWNLTNALALTPCP